MTETPYKFTLITGIDYVSIGNVRTFSHALVVETSAGFLKDGPRHRLRGFMVAATMPTFDVELPCHEFSLTDAASRDVFIGDDDDEPRPLMTGAIMRFPGLDKEIQLIASYRSAIEVLRLPDGTEYDALYTELASRVAHHWSALDMPAVVFHPASVVRQFHGRPKFPVTKTK